VIFLQFYLHWPDFLYRGTTVDFGDFGDVCLPGVPFRRFNHTPGLGPDVPVVFNMCRVLLHPFKGVVPGFNGWFTVFVAPDGIMFFGIWFAFWDAIICYVDDNIRKLLNRILCTAGSSKAAWCENAAQSALWSFQVGLAKDGEGVSVVMTIR